MQTIENLQAIRVRYSDTSHCRSIQNFQLLLHRLQFYSSTLPLLSVTLQLDYGISFWLPSCADTAVLATARRSVLDMLHYCNIKQYSRNAVELSLHRELCQPHCLLCKSKVRKCSSNIHKSNISTENDYQIDVCRTYPRTI